MKKLMMIVCIMAGFVFTTSAADESMGFKLGSQAYTFRSYSFFETLDILSKMGVKYVEAYPGQNIGGGIDGRMGPGMSEEAMKKVLEKLVSSNIKLINFGVTGASRETFEWSKKMGIETIVTESKQQDLPGLDKLCEEFGINIALHNHPRESRYWNPVTVVEACNGLSKRIGSDADTGHWYRSGLNPLECLKLLEGRIISLHFKDLSKAKEDVPWGTGECNASDLLKELERQGFKGVFSIEYENNNSELVSNVEKCVQWFKAWPNVPHSSVVGLSTRMADNVEEIWRDVKVTEAGKWGEDEEGWVNNFIKVSIGGKASASAEGVKGEEYDKAFDDSNSKYCVREPKVWLQYELPNNEKKNITHYAIRSANDAPERDPKDWKVLGSNDGANWEELDSRSNESFTQRYQARLFENKKAGEYRMYRLDVTSNHGGDVCQLSDLQFLVKK